MRLSRGSAVALLKEQTAVHEELIVERQRAEAARAALSERAELQRRYADDLDELKRAFLELAAWDEPRALSRVQPVGCQRGRSTITTPSGWLFLIPALDRGRRRPLICVTREDQG